jgi:hypothetical protein
MIRPLLGSTMIFSAGIAMACAPSAFRVRKNG